MRSLLSVLPFIALTFLCWGNYGPLMHKGIHEMHGSLLPFIFVGIAYFLIAVVVPIFVLWTKGEAGLWTATGTFWSLSAGAAGAVGALGIVLAFKFNGNPVYVMPLVFGFAPVVNTFVTMLMARSYKEASLIFYAGVIVVALGAVGVLIFKPGAASASIFDLSISEKLLVLLSVALTAVSWGSYGPVLHKGQMKMKGSRLRPFMCVGMAYFAIAVVVPMAVLASIPSLEDSHLTMGGTFWSLAAGAAGAVGALGIIMAFNFGGKPIFVMPLVFGCAPVVNTFTTLITDKDFSFNQVQLPFLGALAMVIVGAVTVLVFAPKHGKAPSPAPPAEPEKYLQAESTSPEENSNNDSSNGDSSNGDEPKPDFADSQS